MLQSGFLTARGKNMFQRLSFQKKIFYMASIFFICTALGMSIIFYVYTYHHFTTFP